MKKILSLVISAALIVSGYAQTRNVLVGTNNAVVQPTNFWSADASNARSGLGLGSAATNPSTAFQSASSTLTNLSANNGASLTNLTAANIAGTVGSASNITGTAALATNVTGVVAIANGGTGTNSISGARTALGATTIGANLFTLANPDDTRFIRLNANNSVSSLTAADMRTALSVGTNLGTVTSVGMTVPSFLSVSTASITSSGTFAITLANQTSRQLLITPNGGGIPAFRLLESDDLPSLAISKITGLQTALDGKLSTTGTAALATNVTGIVALANGGTGATNAAAARTNLGLGWSALTNTDSTNFRTDIGLGATWLANTNVTNFRTDISLGATWLTNTNVTNFRTAIGLGGTDTVLFDRLVLGGENSTRLAASPQPPVGSGIYWPTNSFGPYEFYAPAVSVELIDIAGFIFTSSTNGDSLAMYGDFSIYGALKFGFASNAATSRTNLGLGATWLTNTNASLFREAVGLGTNDSTIVSNATVNGNLTVNVTNVSDSTAAALRLNGTNSAISFGTNNTAGAAITRTNLGLSWSALTNSNSGTSLVSVNTNGVVVSPTNFWQVAPISTTVQYQTNVTGTSTNAATNSRNLFLFSLAPSVSGITNTVTLPTNPATTFEGDRATITHLANSTNAVTAIRQLDAATNLITLNQLNETVLLMYRSGSWMLADNISYVEPIFFSGNDAAGHAAASRTNLGLGETNSVTFSSLTLSSDLTFGSGDNIVLSTTNGTKIGTATNQLLGFYNKTPIAQPSTTGVTTNGFTQGSGNNIHPASTFTGGIGTNAYTISDIVAHLKSLGLIAP